MNEYHDVLRDYFLESIRLLDDRQASRTFCSKRRFLSKQVEEKKSRLDRAIREYKVTNKPGKPNQEVKPPLLPAHSHAKINDPESGDLEHVSTMLAELDGVVATAQAGFSDGDGYACIQGGKRISKDIETFRDISIARAMKVLDGVMVDFQTARAIVETHDCLKKEEHRRAFLSLDIGSMGKIAWKFIKAIRKSGQEKPAC